MRGFGEAIRLALVVGGIQFEDRRVSYSEVAALRKSGALPHGQVPLLEIDGEPYSQSEALLRWAGEKAGLRPVDEHTRLLVDAAHSAISDLNKDLMPQ
jgi:glutathione S-transferase